MYARARRKKERAAQVAAAEEVQTAAGTSAKREKHRGAFSRERSKSFTRTKQLPRLCQLLNISSSRHLTLAVRTVAKVQVNGNKSNKTACCCHTRVPAFCCCCCRCCCRCRLNVRCAARCFEKDKSVKPLERCKLGEAEAAVAAAAEAAAAAAAAATAAAAAAVAVSAWLVPGFSDK